MELPARMDDGSAQLAADALRRLGWRSGRIQVALLAVGCSTRVVAVACGVSPKTVATNCMRRSRRIHRPASAAERTLASAALAGAHRLLTLPTLTEIAEGSASAG